MKVLLRSLGTIGIALEVVLTIATIVSACVDESDKKKRN